MQSQIHNVEDAVVRNNPVGVLHSSLDNLDAAQLSRDLVAYTPTAQEISDLFARSLDAMGTAASLDVIKRIASRNPDTVHGFGSLGSHSIDSPRADGFICWLPLTEPGHRALLDFSFDPADPSIEHVAGQHDKPAAIYIWGIFGPGRGTAGLAWAFQRWSTPQYSDADVYVRAATPSGLRLYDRVGFKPVYPEAASPKRDLVVFRRNPPKKRPLYDTYPSADHGQSVTVVRSPDDFAKVMAVRSAVYVAEQACPYAEEFDGNDYASTHLLGYVADEPVGTIRIRCFATFAKLERLAIRHEHRKSTFALSMIRAAIELCRVKGYTRIYGHAQKRLVGLWSLSGARPIPGAAEFTFSDFDYVQMLLETAPHPDAVSLESDPFTIIRPEGRWHAEGVLERSSRRPATRPSIDTPTVREPRAQRRLA